jgi:hypothetical protein
MPFLNMTLRRYVPLKLGRLNNSPKSNLAEICCVLSAGTVGALPPWNTLTGSLIGASLGFSWLQCAVLEKPPNMLPQAFTNLAKPSTNLAFNLALFPLAFMPRLASSAFNEPTFILSRFAFGMSTNLAPSSSISYCGSIFIATPAGKATSLSSLKSWGPSLSIAS